MNMDTVKSIKFQIIDWYTDNYQEELDETSSNDSDESKKNMDQSKYRIIIFGKDINDKTYSLVVNDFTPYFYIRVPDDFTKDKLKLLEHWIKDPKPSRDNPGANGGGLWYKYHDCLLRLTLHKKMRFRGFTNKRKFNFVRLVFKNTDAMRNCINIFQRKEWDSETRKIKSNNPRQVPPIPGITKKYFTFDLYENMIDPMLRFIHHRDIKPVGWITVPANKYSHIGRITHSDVNIETRWTNIKYNQEETNVKIKVLAYDIECDSSHGDFPLAIKDYLKLAREIVREHERQLKLDSNEVLSNKSDFIKTLLNSTFNGGNDIYNISEVYIKSTFKTPGETIIKKVTKDILKQLVNDTRNLKTLEKNKLINKSIDKINKVLNINFPPLKGDKTIQIGVSLLNYGEFRPYRNIMYTLGSCDPIKDTEVITFNKEEDLLLAFKDLIIGEDPEIITGYNIDNFDTPWLFNRAIELEIDEEFNCISKLRDYKSELKERQEKSGVGELITVKYVNIPGRTQLDIYKLVQKGYNLNSYKLDNVSAEFIQGSIKDIKTGQNNTVIATDNLKGLNIGNFIIFIEKDGYLDNKFMDGKKFEIKGIEGNTFSIDGIVNLDINDKKYIWCLGKDDVTPQDIFRLQKGNSRDRYIIAKYCIMDVILCIELLLKLELITNSIGMANVCLIPLSWSIHRGQGVKILSLVSNILKKEDYLLPYLYRDLSNNESFEGAVVLPPFPGIYKDKPVAVLDYASLYPKSMIMGNLSHETICEDDKWLGDEGARRIEKLGYSYYDVTYDTFEIIYTPAGSVKEKIRTGEKTVRYVKYGEEKGLIPRTLEHLLGARKTTRNKIKYKTVVLNNGKTYSGLLTEKGDEVEIKNQELKININKSDIVEIKDTYTKFEQNVLDGLQLAFKITANSLYGQIGARVGDLYYKDIAASTTSIGRQQLEIARNYCEDESNFEKVLDNGEKIFLKNKTVYGDTDSVFIAFECRDSKGNILLGKDALKETIKLAQVAEKGIKKQLMAPQDLEYEKTFWPFILFTKKRYVGNKYEFDVDKYKQTSMGIVTKRRDNAPIVKVIFGGIIDIIMRTQQIQPSIVFLEKTINQLINGKFGLDALIITKTLASHYKDPDRQAHKVLADRIGERDPGNKPQVNDRIPYVYVEIDEKKFKGTILQGDKIENPDYIVKMDLKPNYQFYITNQIMKPVCQIYGLCLEEIPNYRANTDYDALMKKYLSQGKDRLEATKKVLEKKQAEAGKLLFGSFLRVLENERTKSTEITQWFKRTETKNKPKKIQFKKIEELYDSDSDSDDSDMDYNLNI